MTIESSVSYAPHCGIPFTIVIDDTSLGWDTFIVQVSNMTIVL